MNPDVDQDGYYDFSTYCIWVITVHPENRIQYQFLFLSLQSLEMKITDSYVACEGDYLKVPLRKLAQTIFRDFFQL